MKSKSTVEKRALSSLKAKITEAEKANKNVELTDPEVIKVITAAIKQRMQSHSEYVRFNRIDLAYIEMEDIHIYESYLPAQMTSSEIEMACKEIMQSFLNAITNRNALIGKTIGEFNKKYTGRATTETVKQILEGIV
jgi:uncharacterized protein YqeY